jgi:1,4-dihydroxy-2-naphthoate octaprenyltransferase
MKKSSTRRIISICLIFVLVVNLILIALGKISDLWFWLIILMAAGVSYLMKRR